MTDLNFINAYNEVILDNFNAVLKQNFMFQTQIKFLEEQANQVPALQEKLAKWDDLEREKDGYLHQVNQLKNEITNKDDIIRNSSNTDAERHRLQTALNNQAQDIQMLNNRIGSFESDIEKQKEYIKQLEEMLPNSKRKKLGLPPIEEPKTEEVVVEEVKVEVKTPEKTPVKNDVKLKEVANGGTF